MGANLTPASRREKNGCRAASGTAAAVQLSGLRLTWQVIKQHPLVCCSFVGGLKHEIRPYCHSGQWAVDIRHRSDEWRVTWGHTPH
jgi:hypothetical protein